MRRYAAIYSAHATKGPESNILIIRCALEMTSLQMTQSALLQLQTQLSIKFHLQTLYATGAVNIHTLDMVELSVVGSESMMLCHTTAGVMDLPCA